MTLSITGRCPQTGQLGLAMSSYDVNFSPAYSDLLRLRPHSLAVAGTGAIAAQANTRPGFTAVVMDLIWQGIAARDALEQALAEEEKDTRERFQVGVVDAAGRAAGFTGERTLDWRGHCVGDGWVAAGNILAGERVVEAMGEAFEAQADLPLDDRLLTALEAGIAAGGDRRGQRGASLRIATGDSATELETRVHEHAEPTAELRRLLGIYRQQSDFFSIALEAAAAIRATLTEADVEPFADLTTYEATSRIRALLAERNPSTNTLDKVDTLLAAFSMRQDMAQQRFGDILRVLPV